MLTAPAIQNLKDTLFEPPDGSRPPEVFVILDGAGVRLLPDLLEDEDLEHECLLLGETDPLVLTRAPWLVKLERESPLFDLLCGEGWGQNWGLFLVCAHETPFEDVLDHCREFIQVRLPDGRVVFFRFYDPRVWRAFAPSCDTGQTAALFDVPGAYICEAEDGLSITIDTQRQQAPQRRTVDLHAAAVFPPALPAPEAIHP